MAQLTLSYPDLWSFYRQAEPETQADILDQLNLDNLIPNCTSKVRKEILSDAPLPVAQKYGVTIIPSKLGIFFEKRTS